MNPKRIVATAAALCLMTVSHGASARETGLTPAGPSPGGFASDNVEWVKHWPLEIDTAGARIIGDHLYITTSRGLSIYDLSDPLNPSLTGFTPLPQEPYLAEEDVDTNGTILLISSIDTLYVIDVEDKANPTVIGELAGGEQHTWTCVLDCTYAYGSEGMIADLSDPTSPKVVGNWKKGGPAGQSHDVTEVKPGFVLTSSQPLLLLDARKDPAKPKTIGIGANEDGRFIHSNLWPHSMKDRFILVGGETSGPSCDGEGAGQFMTWDARKWKRTRTFKVIDEYRVTNGLPTDGNAPANLFCTHWFDTHPDYRNGGIVSMAWYEHGTRFFNITKKGKIEEAGYFVPLGGSTSAAYWVNEEIIYTADYNRGIDILRYNP